MKQDVYEDTLVTKILRNLFSKKIKFNLFPAFYKQNHSCNVYTQN